MSLDFIHLSSQMMETAMLLSSRLSTAAGIGLAFLAIAHTGSAQADTGQLRLLADGEDLATEGFLAPKLTRDGWELRFERILVTLANVTAHQTEPPYDAESGAPIESDISVTLVEAPLTVDLLATGETGLVDVVTVEAPSGFYNALSWDLVPGPDGVSMAFVGTAKRDGEEVDFRLATRDAVRHLCGEYVGDERKGILEAGGAAELDVTFHLDHLFGRADRPADGDMNQAALGFDAFASGGEHVFSLAELHIGHVGEGHCHVEAL